MVGATAGAVLAVPRPSRLRRSQSAGWGHVSADLFVAYPTFLVNYTWPLLETRPTSDVSLSVYWTAYAVSGLGLVEGLCILAAVLLLQDGVLIPDPDPESEPGGVE